MIITGLKFMSDKGWNAASVFTLDNGKTVPVPANQKIICLDDNGDVVNVSIQSDVPVQFKSGEQIKPLRLLGVTAHNSFGWTVKAIFA